MNTRTLKIGLLALAISCVQLFLFAGVAHAACTAPEQSTIAQYNAAATNALMAGQIERYEDLQHALPAQLSAGCRTELEQREPMRTRCDELEKTIVLDNYRSSINAARNGDLERALALLFDIEEAVSPACWMATNRHTDPGIQAACSSHELDQMATMAGPVLHATARMLSTMDGAEVMGLAQQMMSSLTPKCLQAVDAYTRAHQPAPSPNSRPGEAFTPSNVIDHGGGTFSSPGLGACTPGGCIAY